MEGAGENQKQQLGGVGEGKRETEERGKRETEERSKCEDSAIGWGKKGWKKRKKKKKKKQL